MADGSNAPIVSAADFARVLLLGQKVGEGLTPSILVQVDMNGLLSLIAGATSGYKRYATTAIKEAATEPNGTLSFVYANNDDPADPENGWFQADDSDPDGWVRASWISNDLIADVQPLVDEATAVLADAGFIAVSTDLQGANNIGAIAADLVGENNIGNLVANMAAIVSAPEVLADIEAAVEEAVTALGSLFAPSYSDPLSQNDRVATLTANGASITTGLAFSGGNVTNLFNGNTTNDNTGGVVATGLALTGVVIWQVIFPKKVWLLCNEWQQINSGTQTYGTGILQALKADGTWVTVSDDAANGGATTVTRAATAVDKAGYGGLRLVGTGGTAGSGRILENKFKLCPGTLNGTVPLPSTTDQGKVPIQLSGVAGDWGTAKPIDYFETRVAGKGLLRSFAFDQNDDEGMLYDRSGNGATIDLSAMVSTYGGKISRVREGRLLEKALFQTASLTNMRTAVMVLIPDREDGSTTRMVSTATNGGLINLGYTLGGQFANGATVHAGHGGIEVQPVHHTGGGYARKLGRGGPMMIFYEASAAVTNKFGVGGNIDTVDPTGRVVRMKIAYLDIYTGQLDATDRTFIRRGLRRVMALRGIYFDYRDCPTQIVCRMLNGQSNANGDAFLSELAAGDQLRTWTPFCDIMTGIADSNGTPLWSYQQPSQFRLGFNHRLALTDRMGPEVGLVFAHEEAVNTRTRRLSINKFAVSSTSLEQHWKSTASPASGLFWLALSHWWASEQAYLARGIGPKLIGQDWNQWQNDALDSGFAANYATNIGANWTKLKEQTGYSSSGLRMNVTEPADPDSNYAYFSTIDAAITSFDAANDDVTKVSVAGLSYREVSPAKRVHFTADSYVTLGRRYDAANPSV